MTRTASCPCGALKAHCEGEPVGVSVCHCLECQKRTGSAFGAQARFREEQVTVEGASHQWSRTGDEGTSATFEFCPTCGMTVMWRNDAMPGFIAVTVGAFADPGFPPPKRVVYETRAHPWVEVHGIEERWD
ncbi:MAG: aldehyde-activating protein [Caulobacteraceae bacterium]|nr:MAG: aldehyde-activating protein [Caulobacteraceae bacterium]